MEYCCSDDSECASGPSRPEMTAFVVVVVECCGKIEAGGGGGVCVCGCAAAAGCGGDCGRPGGGGGGKDPGAGGGGGWSMKRIANAADGCAGIVCC